MSTDDARQWFKTATGKTIYTWQDEWMQSLIRGRARDVAAPTGCGKTALIACWMAARVAGHEQVPTRLCWVIDRRAVVDQVKAEAEKWAAALAEHDFRVEVRTLRGEQIDDAMVDPATPAVIVGTTDMIGSRLLMRGYGMSWKQWAPAAGLLTHDTLIALDEAHLSRPFLELVRQLAARDDVQRLHVSGVSASLKTDSCSPHLNDPTLEDELRRRLTGRKRIRIEKGRTALEAAQKLADANQRVVIIVRRPEDAQAIAAKLGKKRTTYLVTGEQRSYERDRNTKIVMERFASATHNRNTLYLVGTSALEVGMDVTCETLITEWTDAIGIQQRSGRLNRHGTGDGDLVVVGEPDGWGPERSDLRVATRRAEKATRNWLSRKSDASPRNLLDAPEAAIYPPAKTVPLLPEDIALLSCTTPPAPRPRIPLDVLIHGLQVTASMPSIEVAARNELTELNCCARRNPDGALWPRNGLKKWRKTYPVRAHETAKIKLEKVLKWLEARRRDGLHVVISQHQDAKSWHIPDLLEHAETQTWMLERARLVLPADWMDVDDHGTVRLLDAVAPGNRDEDESAPSSDVACADESRQVTKVEHPQGADFFQPHECSEWSWEVQRNAETKRETYKWQSLADHAAATEEAARHLIRALSLRDPEADALIQFARHHDGGKAEDAFQANLSRYGLPKELDGQPLAHTPYRSTGSATKYRHELGSLTEVNLSMLARALIMTHHGYGRPFFDSDAGIGSRELKKLIRQAARIFDDGTRIAGGEYGLAWLSCLALAADIAGTEKEIKKWS